MKPTQLFLLLFVVPINVSAQERTQSDLDSAAALGQLLQLQAPSPQVPPVEAPVAPEGVQCELRIKVPKSEGRERVIITNTGDKPVSLVAPGDGSDIHWRTPIVSWSFLPADSSKEHPKRPPFPQGVLRCGHRNTVSKADVFTLNPGESRDISKWFGCLTAPAKAGKYRAVCYYWNVPTMKWRGQSFADDDPDVMKRVTASTPIALISNEVEVEFAENGITMR